MTNKEKPNVMTMAFTGHRPDKLGGYNETVWKELVSFLKEVLSFWHPDRVVVGMALGVDQAAAEAASELKIPFLAAVPYKGQEKIWPTPSQKRYHEILAKAAEVVYVSGEGHANEKLDVRNRWMIDHSDILVAVWNGTPGGTGNCLKYAESKAGYPVVNHWDAWVAHAKEKGIPVSKTHTRTAR